MAKFDKSLITSFLKSNLLSILYNRRVYNERDIIAKDVEQYEAFLGRLTNPAFPPPAGFVRIIVNLGRLSVRETRREEEKSWKEEEKP